MPNPHYIPDDKLVKLAVQLQALGVSQAGVSELLKAYPLEIIERQLAFLPYRKARRKEAFIIEAIRHNYAAPKEFFYAQTEAQPAGDDWKLDEAAELPDRLAPAEPEGHRASGAPGLDPSNLWLEPTERFGEAQVQDADPQDWAA